MVKYNNVKSKFIRDKIKKTKFEDRAYIDDLIFLEDCIVGKINPEKIGWLGNMKLHGLKNKYFGEFAEIYMELNSEEWKKLKENDRKEMIKEVKRLQKLDEDKGKELAKIKEEWVVVGGLG